MKMPQTAAMCAPEDQPTRDAGDRSLRKFQRGVVAAAEELHQHFYNLYAYCRWRMTSATNSGKKRALELLDWWSGIERLL